MQVPNKRPAREACLVRTFTFAATGDAIITRQIHGLKNDGLGLLVEKIVSADAAFTNVELVTPRAQTPAAAEYGGIHLGLPPYVLDELKRTGFTLFNLAHNHALDFGHSGLLDTIEEMRKRDMIFAGAGTTLGEARMPAYVETPAGRVALVAVASTYTAGAQAGASRADFPGRPGINPLRHTVTHLVTREQWDAIRHLDEEMGTAQVARREHSFGLSGKKKESSNTYTFLGHSFRVSCGAGTTSDFNEQDWEAIRRSINAARRQADYVVVSLHGHEGPAGQINGDRPAEFIIKFARACVRAGADAFVGHGPHMLQGIEIYQEKPIFYSLGNFMFMCEQITQLPSELYDLYGLPCHATPADLFDFESQDQHGNPKAFHADERFWETVLPLCTFHEGRLDRIELHPVSLQLQEKRTRRGVPQLAKGKHGAFILDRLAALSQSFGTKLQISGSCEHPVARVEIRGS